MNFQKVLKVSTNIQSKSLSLSKLFGTAADLESATSRQTVVLKKKLLEEKKLTYKSLLDSLQKKEDKDNGIFQGVLGALGLGGLARGLRGLKPPKGLAPPVVRPTRGLGRLGRLGRAAGPLQLLFAGLDYAGRRGEGQTQTQAITGTAAGSIGAIAGGVIGQTLIPIPGVGFIAGSMLGGMLGGAVADRATGVTERLKEEERKVIVAGPSLFAGSLDKFDSVINKFSEYADGLSKACDCEEVLEDAEVDFTGAIVGATTGFFADVLERFGLDDAGFAELQRQYEGPDATDRLLERINVDPRFRPLIEGLVGAIVMGAGRGRGLKPLAKPGSPVTITPQKPVVPRQPRPSGSRIPKRLPQSQETITPEVVNPFQKATPKRLRADEAFTKTQRDAIQGMRTDQRNRQEFVRDLMGKKPTGKGTDPKLEKEVINYEDGPVEFRRPGGDYVTSEEYMMRRLMKEYPGRNIEKLMNPKKPTLKEQLKKFGDQSSVLFDSNNTIINGGGAAGGGMIAFVEIDPSEVADKYTQMLQASRFG